MRQVSFIIILFAVLLMAGCSGQSETEEPPEIIYGQDPCYRCGMIINEEKYAAAYWTAEGEARLFDDIGGMLAHIGEASEDAASYWVHDFDTSEWLNAEKASYVIDNGLKTPMGFGLAAFSDIEAAEAYAQGRDASLMTFEEMLAMDIRRPADVHMDHG